MAVFRVQVVVYVEADDSLAACSDVITRLELGTRAPDACILATEGDASAHDARELARLHELMAALTSR